MAEKRGEMNHERTMPPTPPINGKVSFLAYQITQSLPFNAIVIPMSNEMTISQWHVPINDQECYWYAIFTDFERKVNRQEMRDQRLELYTLPNYKPLRNRTNAWGYDPEEQRTQTYTGWGWI